MPAQQGVGQTKAQGLMRHSTWVIIVAPVRLQVLLSQKPLN